ncbi:MAG: hypothetical protein ABJI60_16700 [Kangiellaceae bacterium]|jgi:hypothetical protein
MVYFLLLVISIIFVELFIALKILPDAQSVLKLSSESVKVMQSKQMTDDEKEAFMRKNSVTMMKATLIFSAKFISIFVVLFAFIYGVELYSVDLATQLSESFYSLTLMSLLTLVTLVYVWIRNVIRRKL